MMGDLVSSNRAGTSLPDSPSSLERLIQSLNWEEAVGSTGYQSSHSPPPPPLHLWDNLFICPVFWILPHLSQIRLILDLTLKHCLHFHFCLGREGKAE